MRATNTASVRPSSTFVQASAVPRRCQLPSTRRNCSTVRPTPPEACGGDLLGAAGGSSTNSMSMRALLAVGDTLTIRTRSDGASGVAVGPVSPHDIGRGPIPLRLPPRRVSAMRREFTRCVPSLLRMARNGTVLGFWIRSRRRTMLGSFGDDGWQVVPYLGVSDSVPGCRGARAGLADLAGISWGRPLDVVDVLRVL